MDCGASTLIALKRENLSANHIDVILISHLHGDHFGGLPFLLCEILAMGKRKKVLTIIGPAEVRQRSQEALTCLYPGFDLNASDLIRFATYETERAFELGSFRLTAYKAIHSPETHPHILRVETDNIVITYSGDTEWTEDLINASADADLFICEASSYHQKLKYHLSVRELVEHKHRITAKKIVLTHLGEDALSRRNEIPFVVADDGDVVWRKC